MYQFVLVNGAPIAATGKVICNGIEFPFFNEESKERAIKWANSREYQLGTLEPPPDELLNALDRQKFKNGKALQDYIKAWENGETQDNLESRVNVLEEVIDLMLGGNKKDRLAQAKEFSKKLSL